MYVNTLGNSKASHVGNYFLDENCTHKSNLPYPLEYSSCTVYNCIIDIFLLVFYKNCNVQCYVNQSNV
jgi:hypothetical protein